MGKLRRGVSCAVDDVSRRVGGSDRLTTGRACLASALEPYKSWHHTCSNFSSKRFCSSEAKEEICWANKRAKMLLTIGIEPMISSFSRLDSIKAVEVGY